MSLFCAALETHCQGRSCKLHPEWRQYAFALSARSSGCGHTLCYVCSKATLHPNAYLCKQGLDVASLLQHLPQAILQSAPVAFALKVHLAWRQQDYFTYLRMHETADWDQEVLMRPRLRQVTQ